MFTRKIFFLACLASVNLVYALPVEQNTAGAVAKSRLVHDNMQDNHSIYFLTTIEDDKTGSALAYVFELDPAGYIIVAGDNNLPPVIAYSYTNLCYDNQHGENILFDIIRMDVITRLSNSGSIPEEVQIEYENQWHEYITGDFVALAPLQFQQWPPEGSTPTGGWLMENWNQSAPYNMYCPMDLIAGSRSVAGCPAVAMAAILNFLEEINATRFDDSDDYYHNYHEYYWIDDDHLAHDFPSWPELNVYLDTLEYHYNNAVPPTPTDKAALVLASGFACHQVYTASVSGTFGVNQAATAYQRFGFDESELLYETSDSLFERLSQNMKDAKPAHLAIVDQGPTYGHNLVIDGYNTDDFYHFNFGWSGSYNGWYQFPLTGMPYNMNIIEGIILDIGEGQPGIEEDDDILSDGFFLTLACLSNPVRSNLSLCITLQQASHVNLTIYSITGRLVSILADREFSPGAHELHWNADGLASGVYIVSAISPQSMVSKKIIVLK
jgi:hypothetical protein